MKKWKDSSTFFEEKLSGDTFTYPRNCFLKKLSYLSYFLHMFVTGKDKKIPRHCIGGNSGGSIMMCRNINSLLDIKVKIYFLEV